MAPEKGTEGKKKKKVRKNPSVLKGKKVCFLFGEKKKGVSAPAAPTEKGHHQRGRQSKRSACQLSSNAKREST